jgi:hypothetical protein
MLGDVGNMPPLPGIFPDYSAPIVRNHADGRELVFARWGTPSSKSMIEGRKSDTGVINVRNAARLIGEDGSASRAVASFRSHRSPTTRAGRTASNISVSDA